MTITISGHSTPHRFVGGFVVCTALAMIAGTSGWATSAAAEASASTPAVTEAQTAAPGTAALVVDGFRSAKFGMDEKAVRAEIQSDFGLKDDKIAAGENAVERTSILTVAVPDLIPQGGIAQVSYVFGYKTKKLIQVGVSWSQKTDPAMTAKMLYDNGDVLRTHFMAAGYTPSSVKTNAALPNGVLLFRGEGAEGHATLLMLQGVYSAEKDGRKALTPSSLDLLYSVNPTDPDIFKLPKGSF